MPSTTNKLYKEKLHRRSFFWVIFVSVFYFWSGSIKKFLFLNQKVSLSLFLGEGAGKKKSLVGLFYTTTIFGFLYLRWFSRQFKNRSLWVILVYCQLSVTPSDDLNRLLSYT